MIKSLGTLQTLSQHGLCQQLNKYGFAWVIKWDTKSLNKGSVLLLHRSSACAVVKIIAYSAL